MTRENGSDMARDIDPAAQACLDEHLSAWPQLAHRIYRQLMHELHSREVVTVDEIYEQTLTACSLQADAAPEVSEVEATNRLIRDYAIRYLSREQIDEAVSMARKREEADALRSIVSLPSISFRVLADRVRRFCSVDTTTRRIEPEEAIGIRVGLIRHLVSDQLEFIGVAKRFLTIRDMDVIMQHIIGPEHGMGRIGGKAAGMFLAYKILVSDPSADPEPQATKTAGVPAKPVDHSPPREPLKVSIPESYFLRSDVIDEFLELNGLGEYQTQKYKSPEEIRSQYPLIRQEFRKGRFPPAIVERLRQMLLSLGTVPLIVRSSSLLEDRFGTAFSGKYASVFVPNQARGDLRQRVVSNQGRLEQRVRALLTAIAEVYASALGPDPLLYRRAHDLIDYQEDMGVLIQKVVGVRHGNYYLPAFAGVAFSRNEYRWSPRIRREDGLLRMVMGLGTRAIERVGNEYPRMVALGEPTLRPESQPQEIIRNAQRSVDCINLTTNRFETVPIDTLLAEGIDFPMLDRIMSIRRDGALYQPPGAILTEDPRLLTVTFDKLLRDTDFPTTMRDMLRRLEGAYRRPVDVEFAHDGTDLYVLQCRAQSEMAQASKTVVPTDVPRDAVVFRANKYVRTGQIDDIEYVIYVPPEEYDALATRERRVEVGRAIGSINHALHDRRFILVGPGRWGSNDLRLGVPVTYADINHARMLIEVARERDGYVPEVSFGTHFFQDLVEANILYLPLYPDDPATQWNSAFFDGRCEPIGSLLPDGESLGTVIRVLHVPAACGGRKLRVVMDGNTDTAMGYLV